MYILPPNRLWADDVHNANLGRPLANREDKRRADRMARGKPNKGTPKDKRLKRNRRKRRK